MADSDDKSDSKSTPLPWVVLSGLLGVLAVGTPIANHITKDKDTDKKQTAADPAPPRTISKRPFLKPIYDFYATDDGQGSEPGKAIEQAIEEAKNNLRARRHNYQVEFLIATVPDPIDTPYGYAFDQAVDAIQRAVEKKNGCILDRAWLPWEFDKKPPPGDKSAAANYRESYPGVLLFRHEKQVDHQIHSSGLYIVFLVGETPTGGLHKRAFTRALRIMTDAGHSVTEPVRVIGPYFSGSQTSLQFVVGDWWAGMNGWFFPNPAYRFDVISGNATALHRKDLFQLDPYSDGHPDWQPDKFSISATVAPTKTIIGATLHYLARRDGSQSDEKVKPGLALLPGKVALLAESNTGYGRSVSTFTGDQVLMLRFPLNISRVKNEYTEAFRQQDQQAGLKSTDTFIPSGFEETNPGTDGVPSQGGATTTTMSSQVISNILTTIAREQCRYVGVIATDTRDKLFLVRLIREFCPDVHVFVTDADQLLLHPDYQYYMRGVIVGSSYPLIGQNQRWVKPDAKERILFATVGAQGCYNAALMHLGLHKDLLEYAPPSFVEHKTGAETTSLQRPPIWISVISPNGTLAPLQVYTEYDDSGGNIRLNPEPAEVALPAALTYPGAMLPVGIALLSFWTFLVFQALFARSSRMFWAPVAASGEFSLPQLCYRNLLLGSQAVLAVPVLAIVYAHGQANQFQSFWMPALAGLTCLLTVGFMAGMIKPLCWPPSRLRQFAHWLKPRKLEGGVLEVWSWSAVNVVLVAVIAGYAILFIGRFWEYGGATRRTLFFIRAVDLTSGQSPLTPLFFMCMGLAAWAYFQLQRAYQIDHYAVPPPFPTGSGETTIDGTFSRINDLDRIVQDEVRHESLVMRHPQATLVTMLALFALGLAVWLQSLPTVEGWSWDVLFYTGFWIMFALSTSTLVRLFFLWRHTKKLLNTISLVPMMRAFSRLPAKVTDQFGKYLFTQKPKLEHLQLPMHQLHLLGDAIAKTPDAPPELAELERVAQALSRRLQEGLDDSADKTIARRAERDVRGKLSALAASCLTVLAPRWKNLPIEDAYGGGAKDDKSKPASETEPSWAPLAENVVATQIIIYVSQFFGQLRSLAVAALVCTSLLLLSATSYPFHPERLLLVCLLGLSALGLVAVIWVLFDMNRDEVVSRMLKTTPGKLSLDSGFVGSFLTYILPVLGVLTAQLSGSFRWLLEPILHVMK